MYSFCSACTEHKAGRKALWPLLSRRVLPFCFCNGLMVSSLMVALCTDH